MVKLVAVCRDDEDYPFESRQLPVNVDKNLTLVLQMDDPLQSGFRNSDAKSDLRTFIKNYDILHLEEVKQACMLNGKDLTTFLSHMVPCVGCRRSVEQMFQQLSDQRHPALDPLLVSSRGTMSIKKNILTNPTALYKLFYHDVFHMYGLIENILKNKKNKRCFIHSLEMQKPRLGRALAMSPNIGQACTNLSSLPPAQPASIPYYGSGSWMDIWNDLSNDCKEEVVILDCEGILDLMEDYLKRHRFCKDCKSKVARAFGILVDEIDPKKEGGYCSALYVGLRFCGPKSRLNSEEEDEEDDTENEDSSEGEMEDCCEHHETECCGHDPEDHCEGVDKVIHEKTGTLDKATETSGGSVTSSQSRHIHVCCETNYIAHLMTRAEAEISGGRRERHAKSIDVAQEEVLTCISLYLYERLHRLWRKVRAETQTWRVLFYVSVETARRVFEIVVEEKVGMGKLEALCEELEEQERKQEEKQEKKRQKKKRQKKRKEEAKKLEEAEVIPCDGNAVKPASPDQVKHHSVCNNSGIKTVCSNNHVCRRGVKDEGDRSPGFQASDLGYSSGYCESGVSSREGSDVTCSDGFCNHDESDCAEKENKAAFQLKCSKKSDRCEQTGCRPCQMAKAPPISTVQAEGSCDECQNSQDTVKSSKKSKKKGHVHCAGGGNKGNQKLERGNFQSRLLEMLGEESDMFSGQGHGHNLRLVNSEIPGLLGHDPDDDVDSDAGGLTAEEIAEFEQNRGRIHEERIVLREKIKKNFEQLCGQQDKVKSHNSEKGKSHTGEKGKSQNGANQSSGKKGKSRK